MDKTKKIAFFSALYEGTERDKQTFGRWLINILLVAISYVGFVLCMTLLYHAMRGVMDLGGFVASGGPYRIAHQAPGWIWVFPVSIFAGVFFLFLYAPFARKIGGLKLGIMFWPALFCTLGYNFLAYSFPPASKGGGIVAGWLIPGILFELMGGIPLIFIIAQTFRYIGQRDYRRQLREKAVPFPTDRGAEQSYLPGWFVSFSVLIVNLGGIAAGIYLAISYFHKLTS